MRCPTWVEWTQDAARGRDHLGRHPPAAPDGVHPGAAARQDRRSACASPIVGDPAEGERLFQPIRDVGPTLIDAVAEMPAAEIATIHNDPTDPGPGWDRGMLLDGHRRRLRRGLPRSGRTRTSRCRSSRSRSATSAEPPIATYRKAVRSAVAAALTRFSWPASPTRACSTTVLPPAADGLLAHSPLDLGRDHHQLRRRSDGPRLVRGLLADRYLHPPGRNTRDLRPEHPVPLRPSLTQKAGMMFLP